MGTYTYRFWPVMGLLLLVMITLSSAMIPERTDEEVRAVYDEWRAKHGKLRGERENRFEIFKDNLKYIDQINAQNLPYRLGLNAFADVTNEEYQSMYLRANLAVGSRRNETSSSHQPRLGVNVPDSIDWRAKGAVAGIKDQGPCGSCWAFSTIAAVESISQIVTGKLMTLSEQELVSCDTSNHGCNGGNLNRAFLFIINNRGVDTDTDYRYTASDDPCIESKKNTRVVTIDGYVDVLHNNENALKEAAAKQVVSVYIDASGRSFQLYQSGILTGECGTNLNHAVNVVGYGSEGGMDYWIVRNSWGVSWGDSGYIRMQRNIAFRPEGLCGIAMWPSYPIKNGPNPPTVCDEYNSCDAGDTCCCLVSSSNSCLEWGCCPYGYPICDGPHRLCWTGQGQGKNDLFEVKAMRRTTAAAKPLWAQLGGVGKSRCATA